MVGDALLNAASGPVRAQDVAEAARRLGVGPGDALVVHSSILALGRLGAVADRRAFARGFVDPLLETVGPAGGLLFPVFNFDFCKTGVMDMDQTPTTMGLLAEQVRLLPGSRRTRHPIYSYSILGPGAEPFLGASAKTCFGPGSIFDLMQRHRPEGGAVRLLFLGIPCPPDACTYVHCLEEEMAVPYRYHKRFPGVMREEGREVPVETDFYVRDLEVPVLYNGQGLWERWLGAGIARRRPLGDGQAVCLDVADVRRVTLEAMAERIDFMCRGGYSKLVR